MEDPVLGKLAQGASREEPTQLAIPFEREIADSLISSHVGFCPNFDTPLMTFLWLTTQLSVDDRAMTGCIGQATASHCVSLQITGASPRTRSAT